LDHDEVQRRIWKMWNPKDSAGRYLCKNTFQGRSFVADQRGNLCVRENIEENSGCCNISLFNLPQECSNICDKKWNCCPEYEFCVACCIGTKSYEKITARWVEGTEDPFELCSSKCRTSSKSVMNQNKYRSDWKFCYSESQIPPLRVPQ